MEGARSRRSKKVSAKMSVVSEEDKRQAVQARLDALENDDVEEAFNAAGSDDEFQLEDSDEGTLCPLMPGVRHLSCTVKGLAP